ncbi:MAG: hypothetical protein WCV88_03150 [Patescibacteria group bacterium]|jgi:hypothetical protein
MEKSPFKVQPKNIEGMKPTLKEESEQPMTDEEIKSEIAFCAARKREQLDNFEKYSGKYKEGEMVPELGEWLSSDTSVWDNKISALKAHLIQE